MNRCFVRAQLKVAYRTPEHGAALALLASSCVAALGVSKPNRTVTSGSSFDTVRSLLAHADKGNVRTPEALVIALYVPLMLVVGVIQLVLAARLPVDTGVSAQLHQMTLE